MHADVIRLSVFIGMLLLMALLEARWPKRQRGLSRQRRWSNNLALMVFNGALLRLVFPAGAAGWAVYVQTQGWGLLSWLAWPDGLAVLLAVLLLDLAIYAQHVVMHRLPLLWRLHRMHHSDTDLDVSSGLRFHPLEMLLSMAYKWALIALLGAPVLAVLLFEILLNAGAMFNHANVAMPLSWDHLLRRVLVTPDMHRIHHSVLPKETNSNYGFNLSFWDRLFGTYIAQPKAGHQGMQLGLADYRSAREHDLDRLLLQPLR